MASRVSRRRAATRGLLLFAGLGVWAGLRLPIATAQIIEQPGDVPLPPDAPPVGQPAVPHDPSSAPVGQTGDETQPADQPAPAVAAPSATPEAVATAPWGVPPVKLTIPALGVEAAVEAVAEDPDGAMSVPTDPDGVAWWSLGPGMGVPGNAVFAAHVNWDNRLRPFGLLHRLGEGDAIQVIDEQGRGFEYVVESSHWVRAEGAPLDEIFAQSDVPVVTLITCGGEYVAARREYLDRLIVKAKGAFTS
jgi:hypothetical protein